MKKLLILLLSIYLSSCTTYQKVTWLGHIQNDNSAVKAEDMFFTEKKVSVVALPSGELEIELSGALNLEHPECSNIEDKTIRVPIYAYLIQHSELGNILIDTGCSSEYIGNPFGPMEGIVVSSVMTETYLNQNQTIENQLAHNGLLPEDISTILFTHLHFDHTSGLSVFPENIKLIAGKGETSPTINGFIVPNHFNSKNTIQQLDFTSSVAVESPVGRTIDLFGDGSVWAISTSGHSKGHVSYLINTVNGPVLIAGDASILNMSLELNVGPGTYSENIKEAQKTLERIYTFQNENPNLLVWSGHDFPLLE